MNSDRPSIFRVFVSYRRRDHKTHNFPERLYQELHDRTVNAPAPGFASESHISVYLDTKEPSGGAVGEDLREKIRNSHAMILVVSSGMNTPAAEGDDLVLRELEWWREYHEDNAPIVVRIETTGDARDDPPILAEAWPDQEPEHFPIDTYSKFEEAHERGEWNALLERILKALPLAGWREVESRNRLLRRRVSRLEELESQLRAAAERHDERLAETEERLVTARQRVVSTTEKLENAAAKIASLQEVRNELSDARSKLSGLRAVAIAGAAGTVLALIALVWSFSIVSNAEAQLGIWKQALLVTPNSEEVRNLMGEFRETTQQARQELEAATASAALIVESGKLTEIEKAVADLKAQREALIEKNIEWAGRANAQVAPLIRSLDALHTEEKKHFEAARIELEKASSALATARGSLVEALPNTSQDDWKRFILTVQEVRAALLELSPSVETLANRVHVQPGHVSAPPEPAPDAPTLPRPAE